MGFGKDNKGVIIRETDSVALTTIAEGSVKLLAGLTLGEDFRMIKTVVTAVVTGLTAGEGVGLQLGIANGELSEAEVAEAINADGPVNRDDRLSTERAERFATIVAMTREADVNGTELTMLGPEGGPIVEKTIRWTFSNPNGWQWFVHNIGIVLTTGSTIRLQATHYGVWLS